MLIDISIFILLFSFLNICDIIYIKHKDLERNAMCKKYIISTDVTSDLPENFLKENNIDILYLTYNTGGIDYNGNNSLSPKEFYQKMRDGEMTKTSQVSPEATEATFEKILLDGYDILHIGFSSGLSGSYNSARIAAENLLVKYPDSKIRVIDSLCASLGEGLLVFKAIELKKQDKSLAEVADWVEENKLHLCHMFTVDDLMYLHRGGRVSKASAIAGSILGIKPILHVDNGGNLIPIGKVRGRKQSLIELVDKMGEKMGDWENTTFAISHGDCEDEAFFVRDLVIKRFGIKNCIINYVGTVIGAHSGPKTMALFFMGNER